MSFAFKFLTIFGLVIQVLPCSAFASVTEASQVQWQRAEILDSSTPIEGFVLLNDIFPNNCKNGDASSAYQCLLKVFASDSISTFFQELKLNRTNTDFGLVSEANNPPP